MLFSSYVFIFVFLPITLVAFYLLGLLKNAKRYQSVLLIVASLFFYGYFSIKFLVYLLCSIVINYLFVSYILNKKSRSVFAISIVFNVLFLCYFKYKKFLINSSWTLFNNILLNFILPIGISFYVFQQIQYLITCFKGEEEKRSFQDYLLFILYFPQLLQGPILMSKDWFPVYAESDSKFNIANFNQGLFLFSIGLFKKSVLADTIAVFVDNGYGLDSPTFIISWIISFCYTFQLYFDFSGYCDMAIGVSKMFNIEMPVNFNSPYKSESVSAFWRNWHITLGRSLRNFIYIPLGGNRKGSFRTYINLFLTFVVSGIWHGDDLSFILWGIIYGLLIVLERRFNSQLEKIPNPIRVLITFLIVDLLWVLFRAPTFNEALRIYSGMIGKNSFGFNFNDFSLLAFDSVLNLPAVINFLHVISLLFICGIIVFIFPNSQQKYLNFSSNKKELCITVILFVSSVLTLTRGSVFIYFNF